VSAQIEFPIAAIGDGVVRLRPAADSDIPAIVAATADPQIAHWTRVPERNDERSVREWMDRSGRPGEEISLLVVREDDERLLGAIGLRPELGDRRAEIGYWLAREARGGGNMTRAVRLLATWAFDELPIERIGILAAEANDPSHGVAERAGFVYEGTLRNYTDIKGRQLDMASYSLLRGDLRSQTGSAG
jgi:RimJ/RimL family protein N-acetyltransferase